MPFRWIVQASYERTQFGRCFAHLLDGGQETHAFLVLHDLTKTDQS